MPAASIQQPGQHVGGRLGVGQGPVAGRRLGPKYSASVRQPAVRHVLGPSSSRASTAVSSTAAGGQAISQAAHAAVRKPRSNGALWATSTQPLAKARKARSARAGRRRPADHVVGDAGQLVMSAGIGPPGRTRDENSPVTWPPCQPDRADLGDLASPAQPAGRLHVDDDEVEVCEGCDHDFTLGRGADSPAQARRDGRCQRPARALRTPLCKRSAVGVMAPLPTVEGRGTTNTACESARSG